MYCEGRSSSSGVVIRGSSETRSLVLPGRSDTALDRSSESDFRACFSRVRPSLDLRSLKSPTAELTPGEPLVHTGDVARFSSAEGATWDGARVGVPVVVALCKRACRPSQTVSFIPISVAISADGGTGGGTLDCE